MRRILRLRKRQGQYSAHARPKFIARTLGTIDPSREVERLSEMLGEIMRAAPGVEAYSLESG
jgi:hypothetical protein